MQDQTKRVFRIFFIILMLIMFSLPIFFRARKANLVSRYWPIAKWNSGVMEVKLYGYQDKKTLNIIANSSHAEIMRLDKVINEYDMKSEAGKLKRQFEMGKKNVSVSKELFKLFQFSLDVSKSTKGAFDITVGPLINLWKKSAKKNRIPSPESLKNLRSVFGWKHLFLKEKHYVITHNAKHLSIALGAFSKGYAVDRAIEVLSKQVLSGMVNIGGEIRVFGPKKWKIGIQDPRVEKENTQGDIIGIIEIKNLSVATSGHYRRYSVIGGKKYSHIIDPRTGYPVKQSSLSVTVIAKTSMEADAYATAFCIMSVEDAIKLAEKKNLHVAIITVSKKIYKLHTTKGFEKFWYKKPNFAKKHS